ncbi:MAG TPA: hypothetical protein ENK19_01430, partial [Acidobacteria bacterium]|nr:hypothetical protein [Acidobacteriota bacterium]
PAAALAAVRELVRLTDKPGEELRQALERAVRRARAGSPSLDAVLARHPIASARRPLEALETVELWLDHDVGTVVELRGQGTGRVVEANLELDHLRVDLGKGRPVSVPIGATAKYLRVLPEGSFLHRKVTDPDGLKAEVASQPAEALAHLLESLEGPADVATIKAALDGLLPPAKWTSWWAKARKHPRILTSGSGSRLRYTVAAAAEDAVQAQLEDLRRAAPRGRLALARRLASRGPEEAAAAAEVLAESLAELESADPGLAWETAGVLEGFPGGAEAATATRSRLLETVEPLTLLLGIEDRQARQAALEAIREHRPEAWTTVWGEWLLHEEHAALLDTMVRALVEAGAGELVDQALEAVLRNPVKHPARFVWLCEAVTAKDAPEPVARRMTVSLLERLPDTLTRREFAPWRARAKALLDGGRVAVRLVLEKATPEQAQRFVERIRRAPGVEPQRVRLIEQAGTQVASRKPVEEDPSSLLVATRAAVEAKRAELKELLEVEIPKTLKGINAAAAEGDLRENFEYHMLRDRQELLSARAAKIQEELGRILILEPGAADTSRVNIGTIVHLETLDGTPLEPVTILGQWDADLERRIFANGSGLAQGLLGKEAGDTVEIEGVPARITAIEAWRGD